MTCQILYINVSEPDLQLIVNVDCNVIGLFFQDGRMKNSFNNYPELLIMDATYKLTNVLMPVYVLLGIGPNGESEIVAVFLTAHEDTASLSQQLRLFKDKNPAWTAIHTVMTDKDMAERDAICKLHCCCAYFMCSVPWAVK